MHLRASGLSQRRLAERALNGWSRLALALAIATAGALAAGAQPLPLRFPDIHDDFVVFSYAGDLWRAETAGGPARRLTAHAGLELFPKISADGTTIAFTAEYSGARQVYVMPAAGGAPRQLTFYTDVGTMAPRGGWDYWIQDWTPDGRILVRCNRTPWGRRMGRYCVVDPNGGLETTLPIPHGGSAALSADGKQLAYTPVDREFRTWKRTRGGRAQDIWIYDLENHESQRITTDRGTDNFPIWVDQTIYFTSDREGALNLFAYDTGAGALRQVTQYESGDVLWPSRGPRAIVFHRDGRLYRLDLATEQVSEIVVEIDAALPSTVPSFVDVAGDIASASLSPSAKRIVFEARGELFSVPKEHGPTRNLSRTPAARERAPAWSPDGRWLAYLSDATGEYEIYLRENTRDGDPEVKQLTRDGHSWLYQPVWSHDSKRLAWTDSERRLRVVEVDSGQVAEIDRGTFGDISSIGFSPDDRWLLYQHWHENGLPAIRVHELASGRQLTLGDGLTSDTNPTWSTDGQWLFFVSSRDYQIRFSSFEFNYLYDRAERIFAVPLTATAKPLFPPQSDEEEPAAGHAPGANEEAGDDEAESETPIVDVEPEGFVERTIALPGLAAGSYGNLAATDGALFYLTSDGNAPARLERYDLEQRKAETVLERAQGFEVTPDGKHLLYVAGDTWGVIDAKPGQKTGAGTLELSGLRLKIDPRVEWRQMFTDGWRIVRDFFYDPNMHGVDWQAIGERYNALLAGVGHRADLDFVFGEMISELEAGHTYVNAAGGDSPIERVEGAKLGAELELDDASGRYRIARIFRGENWDPAYRSPLQEPGVAVREGDYLLAIDGVEVEAADNPYRLLEGKADRAVRLTVADRADGERREVVVQPIEDEGNLRYIDWVKSRIELTDRLSGGRIGYIHLPDTAIAGNRMLQKLFYGQVRKEALIVDDRYNGGGFIPDRMIEMLARKTMSYWARRNVASMRTPGFAHDGPKVMLINAYAGSGGDALPYYFRQAGLGKLIGTRTWGGLIGISGAPALADGGVVLPPTFRIYDREGNWTVENEGVEPDIELFDLPELIENGRDPSIEKAVEVLLEELERSPVGDPEVPEPPAHG